MVNLAIVCVEYWMVLRTGLGWGGVTMYLTIQRVQCGTRAQIKHYDDDDGLGRGHRTGIGMGVEG